MGGGIELTYYSNYFNSSNCRFKNNSATSGGAIYLLRDSTY
jgi:hypothetical protein